MQNNIENYLKAQKQNLQNDKVRLNKSVATAKSKIKSDIKTRKDEIKFDEIENAPNPTTSKNHNSTITAKNQTASQNDLNSPTIDIKKDSSPSTSSLPKTRPNPFEFFDNIIQNRSIKSGTETTDDIKKIKEQQQMKNENFTIINESDKLSSSVTKDDKNMANEKSSSNKNIKNKGESEQWISDTFYSYFSSFNEEQRKRENVIYNRQKDYQNYLKQIDDEKSKSSKLNPNSTRTIANSNKNNGINSKNDKTEIEIIVNNPDFKLKHRPYSTRDKLLQDLKHTELSNIVYSNAIQERNRQIAEREIQKKKEYQKELVRQIEKKRKEIQFLKEKEKQEEELSTKKLEEQLRTMKFENEKFNKESKHESDVHLKRQIKSGNDENKQKNKVYKYFSNSARYDNYHSHFNNNNNNSSINDENFFNDTHYSDPLSYRSMNTTEPSINNKNNDYYSDNNNDVLNLKTPSLSSSSCNNTLINKDSLRCQLCEFQKNFEHFFFHHLELEHQSQYHQHNNCSENYQDILLNLNDNNCNQNLLMCENIKLKQFLNNIICSKCAKLYTCTKCSQNRNFWGNPCMQNYCINCGKLINNYVNDKIENDNDNENNRNDYKDDENNHDDKNDDDDDDDDDNDIRIVSAGTVAASKVTKKCDKIPTIVINSNSNSQSKYTKGNKKSQLSNDSDNIKNNQKSFQILEIIYPDKYNENNDDDDEDDNSHRKHIQKIIKNKNQLMKDDQTLLSKKTLIDNSFDEIKMRTNDQLTKYLNNYGDLVNKI